ITRGIKQDFSENQRSNWSRLFCGMEILDSCAPVTFYCIWQGVYRTINRFINQCLLAGRGSLQHKTHHLCSGAGMTNTQTQAMKGRILAKCADGIAQAILTAMSSAMF